MKVKCFPYRTALPKIYDFSFPRQLFADFEKELAKKCGTRPDNHTTYEVEFENEEEKYWIYKEENGIKFSSKVCFFFHDLTVTVGREIVEENF